MLCRIGGSEVNLLEDLVTVTKSASQENLLAEIGKGICGQI